MNKPVSQLTIHMVTSLDGFVAKNDGGVSWMHSTGHYPAGTELTEEAIAHFLEKIDCYLMGSRTYEQALMLGWPYGDKPVIVLTHRQLTSSKNNVRFYAGDLRGLIKEDLKTQYQNIWLVGGPSLVQDCLHLQLADSIVLTIAPVVLGKGVAFFKQLDQEQQLSLKAVTAYQDGMVELTYTINK
ncbi:MAG: dihydrofolate reductase family protein [Bacteroidota bacterium]